jgi:hypothetical protein
MIELFRSLRRERVLSARSAYFNKSFEVSGGGVFLNLMVRRCLIEFALPRQLKREVLPLLTCLKSYGQAL